MNAPLSLMAWIGLVASGVAQGAPIPEYDMPPEDPAADAPPTESRLDEIFETDELQEMSFQKQNRLSAQSFDIPEGGDVDLAFRDTPTKRQFGGTCTTFGLVATMENVIGGSIDLSEKHSWNKYRKYSAITALRTLTRSGVVNESWWPMRRLFPYRGYRNQYWYRLNPAISHGDDINEVLQALKRGNPIYLAMSTPDELYACQVTVTMHTGLTGGGHAVAVVGYKIDPTVEGGVLLKIKNSWGPNCGDKGYQYMPAALCHRGDMYCKMWEITGVTKY